MLRLFYDESTYIVLYEDADTQAYRTDRFEGWLHQPAEIGPVLFTQHVADVLQPDADRRRWRRCEAGLSTGVLIAIIAAGVIVIGGGVRRWSMRNRTIA